MARELRLQIEGDSKSAHRALDDVADESDRTAATLRALGAEMKKAAREGGHLKDELDDVGGTAKVVDRELERLAREADKAADEMRDAARAAEALDRQMAGARVEVTKLQKQLAEGGDEAVVKQLQQQYTAINKIARVKKQIVADEKEAAKRADEAAKAVERHIHAESEGRKAAARAAALLGLGDTQAPRESRLLKLIGLFGSAADRLGSAASKGVSEIADNISPSGVVKTAIGVAAAPALGTIAGGAALAGGALAGVGLGVAGAIANNPEPFRQKWTAAIEDVSRRWQHASEGFEKPTLHAIDILKGALDNLPLEKILSSASKYVEPLARGISGFLKPLGEGIAILVEKAGPVVDVLEQDLPILGRAFQSAFTDIGDGADGGAAALDTLIKSIAGVVIVIGNFIRIASEGYGWLVKYGDFLGAGDKPVLSYGRALDGAKTSTDHFVVTQQDLADAARKAADEISHEGDVMLGLKDANLGVAEATLAFQKGLKENGKSFDETSEKGQANLQNLYELEGAYKRQYDASIAAAGSNTAEQRAAAEAYVAHLESIKAIEKQYGIVDAALDAYIEKVKQESGLTLTTIFRNVYVNEGTPNERQRTGQSRNGGQDNFASGGTVGSSGWKTVGEHGIERVWLNRGDYVSTAEQTRKLAAMMGSAMSGSGGASPVRLVVDPSANQGVGSLIAYLIQTGAVQAFAGSTQISTRPS